MTSWRRVRHKVGLGQLVNYADVDPSTGIRFRTGRTPCSDRLRWGVELFLQCQCRCAEVTLRESGAGRFCRWRERAVTCCRAHNAAADCRPPEKLGMERRTAAKFRRASEHYKSASCPALIALIDRRGKHTALLRTRASLKAVFEFPGLERAGSVHEQPLLSTIQWSLWWRATVACGRGARTG
jgi:hypothetical protein